MKNFIFYINHLITWLFVWLYSAWLDAWPKVKKFIFTWNELITIPLALVLWCLSPTFLRWLDPVSATFDSGILQSLLFAAIGLLFLSGVAWIIFKITFPKAYRWLDDVFESSFDERSFMPAITEKEKMLYLTTYQKCVLSVLLFAIYLFAAVLLVKV